MSSKVLLYITIIHYNKFYKYLQLLNLVLLITSLCDIEGCSSNSAALDIL